MFGFPTSGTKPLYFKDIMTRGKIGYHSRIDRNHSDIFYDRCGGGTSVEAACFAIGFSSEQLVCNVAGQLRMTDIRVCWTRKRHKSVSKHIKYVRDQYHSPHSSRSIFVK